MSKTLNRLSVKNQEKDEWCWASVGAAIANFYRTTGGLMSQCSVANKELPDNDCCNDPDSCNLERSLGHVLGAVRHLDQKVCGPSCAKSIVDKIDHDSPVCVRIKWQDETGHFVAIKGYDDTHPDIYLLIADPDGGKECITPFKSFLTQYKGSGSWTHTYFTK
ncbi:MAG TPA: papain-like cysteine protease family protein [Verrucomicrobiae bacterium]|nr:papain-like cysteine protease family protein [Verrucomicrobiae bacterium]